MKKLFLILLIVLPTDVLNISQAVAGCRIVWSDYQDGSVSTLETLRTQEAASQALEAIEAIFSSSISPSWPGYYRSCDSSGCSEGWYQYPSMLGPMGEDYEATTGGYWSRVYYARWCPDGGCLDASGSWDVVCEPTLIQLSEFKAKPNSRTVILQWSTASETETIGFNIYRAESENGVYDKINDALIPAQGASTQGASYEFTDTNVQNRKTYYYKLEDVDLNGKSTMHGPVSATPRLIYGIGK